MINSLIKVDNNIDVVACLHPFKTQHVKTTMPEGVTLLEILEKVQPDKNLRNCTRIIVNDQLIDKQRWHDYCPNGFDTVLLKVVPMGGGGGKKNVLSIIVSVALIAVGLYTGNYGMIAAGLGGLASVALAPGLPSSGLVLSDLSGDKETLSPTMSIEGARNDARYFNTVPVVLGRHKHVPPLGAKTHTEISGNDQQLRMLVVWGYGPLGIENLRIGETPLEDFGDYEIETIEGRLTDTDLTLFNSIIAEESLSIFLDKVTGFQQRTTEQDVDEISVDIAFFRGLVRYDSKGKRRPVSVEGSIRYRKVGDSTWLAPNYIEHSGIGSDGIPNVRTSIGNAEYTAIDNTEVSIPLQRSSLLVGIYDNGVDQTINNTSYQMKDMPAGVGEHGVQIIATAFGETSKIAAKQVQVTGTIAGGATITETLPAFTAQESETQVRSVNFFTFVDYILIPSHNTGGPETRSHFIFRDQTRNTARGTFRWRVAERGQYEVAVRRDSDDSTDTQVFDEMHWVALRSIQKEDTTAFPFPLAKTALRIKATDKLNAVIDELNAEVTTYALDWDTTSGTWIERLTSNPASLFRLVLQGPANANPLLDDRIDLSNLQEWHEYCDTNKFEFNMVRDFQSSVWETLVDISATGRATPILIDGKYGVIIDQAITIPTQHFTSRNSWAFSAEKIFINNPDAFRVKFVNRDEQWRLDEQIVYDSGYDVGTASLFEEIDAIGITDKDHAWKFGRFALAQARLRPEAWTFQVDFEHVVCMRGDLVTVTHDVLVVGIASGRIKSIQTNGGGDATGITVDEVLTMEAGKTYGVSIRTVADRALTKEIVLNIGEQTAIVFDSVIPVANIPTVGDLFSFGIFGAETIDGLVQSIEPQTDLAARLTVIPYSAAIHDSDTGTIPEFETKITPLYTLPSLVIKDVRADESALVLGSGNVLLMRIAIGVALIPDHFEATIGVQIRLTDSNAEFQNADIDYQDSGQVTLKGVEHFSTYNIRLRWQNPKYLVQGVWTEYNNITVTGQSNVPNPLTGFTISAFGGSALLRWDLPTELDVKFGGKVLFRHSHQLVEATAAWEQSVTIGTQANGSDLIAQLPLKPGTYLAKVQDKGGRLSTVVAISTKQASVLSFANVTTAIEETVFSGTHINTTAVGGVLKLGSTSPFDDWASVDAIVDWDSEGGVSTIGTYEHAAGIDLTTVQNVRLTTDINVVISNVLDLLDSRTGDVDDWDDWDGDNSGSGDARVQERHTDDDPAGTPTWTEWNYLESAEFNARGFDFRTLLTTDDEAFNVNISKLQIVVEDLV